MAGIYIHIPFCRKACHYCDFHFSTSLARRGDMIASLIAEIRSRKVELQNQLVETIYFGGGTPSVLDHKELEWLLTTIYDNFQVSETAEVTLEANPDDCTQALLLTWKSLGVNRLSIGVQSFYQKDLEWMNRSHNNKQAKAALEFAEKAGFKSINLDLIYGIPTMTHEDWLRNVETAFSLPINHISAYSLTVEEGTALHHFIKKQTYPPIKDSDAEEDYVILQKAIKERGWQQYEISNYCKSDNYAKHNTNYWKKEPYIGIGPSAHSYGNGLRRWNIANNAKYMKAIKSGEQYFETEELTILDQVNESIMLGLRTKWGINVQEIEEISGLRFMDVNAIQLEELKNRGLIYQNNDTIALTEAGKLMADGISASLFMV